MTAPIQCYKSQEADAAGMLMSGAPQPPTRRWYFSRKDIECHTPSRSDGIDFKQEQHLQKLYCFFLQELGIELKVPQVTIATAMMFCHRFYMRQSHAKNDWQTIATVCMFLACKAEETPRWLGELVVVAYKLIYKWDPSASRRIREIYDKQKELILIGERLLLATIAFDLNIEHPYKSLVAALKRLGITHKELVKVAWNFVNDWLRTSLCLQHKPHYIAAGSLFLAAKVKKVKLPTAKGKAWWMEFDVSPKQLEDVIQQMMSLWEQSQSQTLTLKDQNVTESLIRKATIYSPQSSTLSGSSIVQDSKMTASMDAGGPAKAATSNCVKKQAFDNVHDTSRETINCHTSDSGSAKDVTSDCVKKHAFDNVQGASKETPNCQTSDTGSAVSVVEDGDSGEPVTVKSDLSSSCKIVSVGGIVGNGQVDVNRIREKLKKRNFVKTMKRKHVEDLDDEIDGEAWIERELEDGIVLESSYAQKQIKI
ncbi:cyclin-T1-3-like isoform X2 [Cynara cardunculus var. scolymus]|uniref:cyclin-T1-3-like isoform X2 n=1 Tax=Cynara cardunculus var. scolymus TaxID=59895 RepID=UPI000D62405E|nr:cyclin-T1-3-like isoform X2 [Cynara cardunculus var. scolymus]XP_024989858.1 cyclin-T1-3-like isoform X2 [Cynara cardunculus var. scolymus]